MPPVRKATTKKTTPAKKVVAKKTAPVKRTVKKPQSASKPKLHAKNMTVVVSVGDKDRDNLIEAMQEAVRKAVEKLGYNASLMSAYYILDGKVCLPKDYDPATQNFKPGAVPPQWAGGPTVNTLLESVGQQEFKVEEKPAYSPKENMDAIRPILEKNAAKRSQSRPKVDEDDELEEIEWEAEDVDDDDLMEEVAEKSRTRAISKLKSTPHKRVVKKPQSASARKTKIVAPKKTVKKPVVKRKR